MIEVKELTKAYGDRTAVDQLNFKLYNGKIYGLFGVNGAGKTTLMNLLTGCTTPTSGTVRINGFDLFGQPLKAKSCIGYLPAQAPLYGELTPFEYLRFVADAKGVPYERALRQIHEAMELAGIEDIKDRLIRNLGDGTRRRVGIAQALLGNPDILLLDEPNEGLNQKEQTELHGLIRQLGEIKTVILSSTEFTEIRELCGEVLVLSKGQLVANVQMDDSDAVRKLETLCQQLCRDAETDARKNGRGNGKREKAVPNERDGEYELIDEKEDRS